MPDLDQLASIAAQLVGRVREETPQSNGAWLLEQLPQPTDWWALCFALAAMVEPDRTVREHLAWARHLETATAIVSKRREPATHKSRSCRRCAVFFEPSAPNGRYCAECRVIVRTTANKHRNHDTYRRGCESCERRGAA